MFKTCPICQTVFETNYKTLYDKPECKKIAKDRRDAKYKKLKRQKTREERKQNPENNLDKKSHTLCTCPTCRHHHIKPGKYDSEWVFCDDCRFQNSEVMSGFIGDFYE